MEKLIAKIRRRLPKTHRLRKSRGADMIQKNGEYYLLDVNTNSVIDTHINLNKCFEHLESEKYFGDSYFILKKMQKEAENMNKSVDKKIALDTIKILADFSKNLRGIDMLHSEGSISDEQIKRFDKQKNTFNSLMKKYDI